MKAIAITLLMLLMPVMASSQHGSKGEREGNRQIVYVCTGRYAKSYHVKSDCKGLQNCKGEILKVTKTEAVAAGRKPCGYCCR